MSPPISVPPFFHQCDTSDVLSLVVGMMNRLIAHNDGIPLTHDNLTRFHSRAAPSISVLDYLQRIVRYASIEKSVLLLLLIYIDRICEIHPSFTISSLTSHRFLISAITAGSKALSDIYCTNTHFARVGGVSVQELNLLELEFCQMINWRLSCSVELLQQYYINLVRTNPNFTLATVTYDMSPAEQLSSSVSSQDSREPHSTTPDPAFSPSRNATSVNPSVPTSTIGGSGNSRKSTHSNLSHITTSSSYTNGSTHSSMSGYSAESESANSV
ncbi:cyclin-domain-containing protein [Polychytrium aggregatum]|uniref:cyclin-domain-containing protein n=1 Tax=Polychytrium aggregatum TaxID=110093 RepID=UPI0022FE1B7B|nr:cyclin-domain-containing protein [Polychytrium aggregatum]XP_052970362.1 cyclin-domain-containing protein [Polychytrium aggregatum]KAI9190719.1 cyclin-domain-containing protein [Polychytrium aggregatum]KAI9208282.1 cyclin-domain-containing protein [Polychytrium aggregatum]